MVLFDSAFPVSDDISLADGKTRALFSAKTRAPSPAITQNKLPAEWALIGLSTGRNFINYLHPV